MSEGKKINQVSRRDFLQKSTAAALGSFFIVPRHVLGKGFTAPSDKLNLAAVGVGGKGFSDITNAWNNGAENVVALCDVDFNYGKKCFDKFPAAKQYKDYRKMLQEMDKDIDAVVISTPDHTHAVIAMAAMQAGKHVYVQKPLTHDIYEARKLTEAARQYKSVTQMGNQGASNPGQQQMVDWFKKGMIGKVSDVEIWTNRPVWPQGIPVPDQKAPVPGTLDWDLFIGPADFVDYTPAYHPFKWRGWWNFGTGALGDMGCHLIDSPFRILELDYPTAVECSVGSVFIKDWTPEYIPEGCPPSSRVEIRFPATKVNKTELKMTWHDGGLRPFHPDWIPADEPLGEDDSSNGVLMIGEKGVMTCGTYGRNPKIYMKNGEKIEMKKGAFENKYSPMPEYGHQTSWTDACKAGFNSKEHKALTSSFDYSGPLTETVLMGNLAIRSYNYRTARENGKGFDYPGRKKLLWDGKTMKITNFQEGNQFVKRDYRGDWKL
ncbi:Gfo/Idh/MocA family protein [Dyadobacter tibetensis]|uniref:Gfo/Idh/MocA family protein n=1 Tax=Dyadobacter tibetensis TaxID=1211851 RepID=UPI0004713221|nr:Gfo/Idh/MocA family oxidoreductase [Dyadobacter tibetensis]